MRKLILSITLLLTLTACSSKVIEPTVVTEYKVVEPTVPAELLVATPAPSPDTLKDVEIAKGEDELRAYGMALLQAHYQNAEKLNSLQELLNER